MPYSDLQKKREYQRLWIAKRREEWFKNSGGCVECGSDQYLELDHIDPAKKISHSVWSWSYERRKNELDKCQVLCKTCHIEKTNMDRGHKEHGTQHAYSKGCRCSQCVLANSQASRDYRARKRSGTLKWGYEWISVSKS